MGKRIKLYYITPNSPALAYYRCTLPAYHLRKARFADTVVDFGRFQKEFVDWADVIIIQRMMGKGVQNLAYYCHMRGKKVVYELDDNVWCFPDSPEYKTERAKDVPRETEEVIRCCDAVTVSTQPIAEEVQRRTGKTTYILPNFLDFEKWNAARVANIKHEHFLVGWMGGHYHVQDLESMTPGLIKILEANKEVVFVFIGCCPMDLVVKYPERVFLQEFMSIDALPKTMAVMKFELGLAPLFPTEFARARSDIRLLQYSALAIPSVVSRWGEYSNMIDDGFPCITVCNGDWQQAVQCGLDNDRREEIGKAAYEFVFPKYDIRENVYRWRNTYEQILSSC